jgi:superfamily II DNA helicase RecQ
LLQKKEGGTKLEDSIIERQENVKHNNFLGILSSGSVIVYVWRQKEAEVVTEQLRAYNIAGGVVCYHGGMDAAARSKSQSQVSLHYVRRNSSALKNIILILILIPVTVYER